MNAPDRLQELQLQNDVTGIDFVYVHADQVNLDVYFHRAPDTLAIPLDSNLQLDQIHLYSPLGGEGLQEIPLDSLSWLTIDGHRVLHLIAEYPGDFTRYNILINDDRIDPFYNNISFSFKANCPSDLDCAPKPHDCPPEELVDFPVNYLARDFWSFRRSLLDFASQRYPDWTDRLEADAGIMLAEMMSAVGDEMAYFQDRVGREAYLETASQRRSLRRHARLVDYDIHDGLGASTWMDITVAAGNNNLLINTGSDVWATSDVQEDIYYEIGRGLAETAVGKTYRVDDRINTLEPHIWDEDAVCLPVGTTEIYVKEHVAAALLPYDDLPEDKEPGKWILLKTTPSDPSIPARAHLVRIVGAIEESTDDVINQDITRLVWEEDQALPFEMNMSFLEVRGNIVPATAGLTMTRYFIVGAEVDDLGLDPSVTLGIERAVEREGRDESVTYLYSLPESDTNVLVWQGEAARQAYPDLRLTSIEYDVVSNSWVEQKEWDWRRSLLGASSQDQDCDFTLEDGTWKRVVGYQRIGEEIVHKDYASGAGFTVRFGDGEFGMIPEETTVFKVEYRLGGGKQGNVSAHSLQNFTGLANVASVDNPLPAENGLNPETAAEIRQLAPEAFRAVTYRAVRPEDYAEAAERLPWVQRAGATFRWTGSWLSAFVTPDPKNTVVLAADRRAELEAQMERFRQAGREVHVSDPIFASIDLEITVCVEPHAYRGEVKERVLETLFGTQGLPPQPGYFSPDNFTFGTPLERSTLEARIQSVSGVRAVEGIRFQRRGWFNWKLFRDLVYDPGKNTIIQVENDLLHPERGTLKLKMKGGA